MLLTLAASFPVGCISGLVAYWITRGGGWKWLAYVGGALAGIASVIAVVALGAQFETPSLANAIIGIAMPGAMFGPLFTFYWPKADATFGKLSHTLQVAFNAMATRGKLLGPGASSNFYRRLFVSAALLIATLGFLATHTYFAGRGLIWNVMHAKIYLTDPCPTPNIFDAFDPLTECSRGFPYRWVLAFAACIFTIGFLWPNKDQTQGTKDKQAGQ